VASVGYMFFDKQSSQSMKKIPIAILLFALALLAWLVLRQPKKSSSDLPATPPQAADMQIPMQSVETNTSTSNLNALIRPNTMDEETWNKWLAYREVVLSENQPVEFYARVVDQNNQPVEGAKLTLVLSRMDENVFSMTNFPNWKPENAQQENLIDMFSDSAGWIKLSGITGHILRVESLSKQEHSWTRPPLDSFAYEPNGEKTVGYADMRNAFDPTKGYIFHLQKTN
jgi:hypothetical protein